MHTPKRAKRALVLAGLAVIVAAALALVPVVVAQTAPDPKSLLGEWIGSWSDRATAKANGRYYLTIEKVEGNKVFGRGEVHAQRTTEFKFQGALEGNRLRYGRDTVADLTIDGDRMEGTTTGRANWSIKLNKQK